MARELRYAVVSEALHERLTAGEFAAGRLLPSEGALASSYGVSRVTIRKALGQLKNEGLIDSRQGFGWYATSTPLRHSLSTLTTIEDQVVASGRSPQRRLLSFAFVLASPSIAELLGCERVLEVSRLNLADNEPLSRATISVPDDLAEDLSRRAVAEHSFHDLLQVTIAGATQTISAIAASSQDAELLHVLEGSPLLRCERRTRDVTGRCVLFSDTAFNPLATEFVVELPATSDIEPAGLTLVPRTVTPVHASRRRTASRAAPHDRLTPLPPWP
jgi:GntR family transcriptional regulator